MFEPPLPSPPSLPPHVSYLFRPPTERRQVKKFLKVDKHLSGLSKIKHEESFLKTGKDFQKIHGSTAKKLDKKALSLSLTHTRSLSLSRALSLTISLSL